MTVDRHASARDYAADEEHLRGQLHAGGLPRHSSNRLFVMLATQIVERDLISALLVNEVTPSELEALGPDGVADFLAGIPSLWATTSLRMQKHSNPNHLWDVHDLNDLKALSVAGVYCDVVVAEKSWIHFMRTAVSRNGSVRSFSPTFATSWELSRASGRASGTRLRPLEGMQESTAGRTGPRPRIDNR